MILINGMPLTRNEIEECFDDSLENVLEIDQDELSILLDEINL